MNFQLRVLDSFNKQVGTLDEKSRRIIYNKIQLIKENPFRFKRLKGKRFSNLFRVRLNIHKKETRLIYTVISPEIIVICLIDRKKDYKDLEKYLKKIS